MTASGSSSRKSSLSAESLSYGRDLWDCLQVLTENTNQRSQQMKSLRAFFSSFKKTLDSFSSGLNKATLQFDRDFVSTREDRHLHIVDTMSTALVNVKGCMDNIIRGLQERAEQVLRDLVEPLELYQKHYHSTNNELLRQGTQFWNSLHLERTGMLFAKENYYNQMYTLHQY